MQPLQRSYAITEECIEAMLSKGRLSSLYDQAKVDELENAEELTGKDQKKLEAYQNNQPVYGKRCLCTESGGFGAGLSFSGGIPACADESPFLRDSR